MRWLKILPVLWALLPWFFWCVYQFHKLDHADPFWLVAIPFVFVSYIPAMVFGSGAGSADWFALGPVIISSIFNLALGAFLIFGFLGNLVKRNK